MEPHPPSADADAPPPIDRPAQPGRRDFVRSLGREGVRSAGQLAGVVGAVSGLPVSISAELLGLGSPDAAGGMSPAPAARPSMAPVRRPLDPVQPPDGPRPWRFDGGALHVLDQRELPGAVRELQLDSAAAVAASLDTLATPFGVALGEIASAGMALAARGLIDAAPAERARALSWNLRLLPHPIALLAAHHRIPVWVVGPSWLATPPGPTPAARSAPTRPAAELGMIGSTRLLPGRADAFVPLLDRTAADLITGVVSEPATG